MLVLSRKPGESIRIGKDVEVVVLQVSGNRVRLGVVAPREVPVWRHNGGLRPEEKAVEPASQGGSPQAGLCVGV